MDQEEGPVNSLQKLALSIAHQCVRDTDVEQWHAEGRITQEEMKVWMENVVDRLYTVVTHLGDEQFADGLELLSSETIVMWNKPKVYEPLVEACLTAATRITR